MFLPIRQHDKDPMRQLNKSDLQTTIVIAVDPTSQNDNAATNNIYAHLKATYDHNSSAKIDPKQKGNKKLQNWQTQHSHVKAASQHNKFRSIAKFIEGISE
jgi:hypothetical protein